MRKLFCLLAVLLVTVLAGLPLSAHAAVPGSSLTAKTHGASTSRLLCILPFCNGPYCRSANGCLVCCNPG